MSGLAAWLLAEAPASGFQAQAGRAFRGGRVFCANRLAVLGLAVVLVLVAMAVLAPLIAVFSPIEQDLARRLLPPGGAHWFGTDQLGRDIFARVVHGARITLLIVGMVAVTAPPLGLLIGCAAGYGGGRVDRALMRLTDVFLAFPRLILALAFVAALGPGIGNAVLAIALTAWPPYARLARAEAMVLREADFISAVRLLGASPLRIVFRHIMPLCLPSLLVRATLDMAGIILTAAGLGFLGLGAQPPAPEWGAMVAMGRQYLLEQPWVATIPGAAIFMVSLGFNLLGDGLRDVMDPKSR